MVTGARENLLIDPALFKMHIYALRDGAKEPPVLVDAKPFPRTVGAASPALRRKLQIFNIPLGNFVEIPAFLPTSPIVDEPGLVPALAKLLPELAEPQTKSPAQSPAPSHAPVPHADPSIGAPIMA
jgi:hypothetical protein